VRLAIAELRTIQITLQFLFNEGGKKHDLRATMGKRAGPWQTDEAEKAKVQSPVSAILLHRRDSSTYGMLVRM
jgi:hypothetical protein